MEQVLGSEGLLADGDSRDNLDIETISTLLSSNIVVHLFNSFNTRESSVFLVDIVSIILGVESDGDTVVLDGGALTFEDFVEGNDFTIGTFNLKERKVSKVKGKK